MGAAVPGASRGQTEAARNVWPHSESGGPTTRHCPTNAIAHPPFWPFSAGRFWDEDIRALFFGRGGARGIPRAHGGRSQSLVPFPVRRTNFAPPPHQRYSPPPVLAFFRWAVLGRDLRALVFGRGCARGIPRAHGGRSQSLAPFRVRRTNFAPPPHQGYSPPPVLALFRWAVLGRGPSGAHSWARLCPGHPEGTRRPLAKFVPIPSPADQLRPTPPPRL